MTTDQIKRELLRQAEQRTLYVSPPYADERCQQAYLSGYEAALGDLAKGWLTDPRNV